MRKQLAAAGIAAALVLVPASAVMADEVDTLAASSVSATAETTSSDDGGDEGLWGLAGLLGLLGLAGLKRRNDPYDRNTGASNRDVR